MRDFPALHYTGCRLSLVYLALFFCGAMLPCAAIAQTVTIPDAGLEAAIRLTLNKSTGDLTQADMESLTSLVAADKNISDLSGLQFAVNLTFIDFASNQISDIFFLSGLTKLTGLGLNANQISNISALGSLTALELLGLSDNQISDISDLSGLTALTFLDLGINQVSNLNPLSELTTLVDLSLLSNQISDISVLSNLTGLNQLLIEGNFIDIREGSDSRMLIDPLVSDGKTVTFIPQFAFIPDPGLTAAIRFTLNIPTGGLFQADLASLTNLTAASRNITDLTGLQFAINLTFLDLGNNQISDLSPLLSLTALTILGLGDNLISDISSVSGLTALEVLSIANNQINDISALNSLTALGFLDLGNNQVSNLIALSGLSALANLSLLGNQISDISDISVLSDLASLSEVLLEGNFIDIREGSDSRVFIGALVSGGIAVTFNPQFAFIPDAGLEAAIRLALNIPTGGLFQFQLGGLTNLSASSSNISDLTGLQFAVNLTLLNLSANQISDLTPLSDLSALTALGLSINQISDMSPLSGLTVLDRLNIHTNQISDLSPLSDLTTLTLADLGLNQISDLNALSGLTNLTTLGLTTNQISDVSVLSGLTGLKLLDLRSNQISDFSVLNGMTRLNFLSLENNFVDIRDGSPDRVMIDVQLANGVDVTFLPQNDFLISDRGLIKAIRSELGLSQGSMITQAHLESLTSLDASSHRINDLSGLEFAINLTNINLFNNRISDVSPLSGLTNLTALNLTNNFLDLDAGSLVRAVTDNLQTLGVGISNGSQKGPETFISNDGLLEVSTQTDKTYQLEVSNDLQNWTPVGAPAPGTGRGFHWQSALRSKGLEFYRVVIAD